MKVEFAPGWASGLGSLDESKASILVESSDEWIVLYSGNLGREHDVETILDCATKLVDREEIVFVIAGEGWKKKHLAERVTSERLKNVRLLPKLPASEFRVLLSQARLGVVTQSLRTVEVCIPSKTFNLLAAGVPVLGIGKPGSDFGSLIHEAGAGRVFQPEQVDEICRFLLACKADENSFAHMKKSAIKLADRFTPANAERLLSQFALTSESDA